MRRRNLYSFLLPLLVTAVVAQTERNTGQDLSNEQRDKIEQLAKFQKHLGKDLNSPGVGLSLKELSRSRAADRTLVTYGLYATGFPPTSSFTLYQIPLDGSFVKTLEGVTLTKQGLAICGGTGNVCENNGPDDPVDLIVYAAKGEPKRFALISEDEGHSKGFVGVQPFPNATTDKGCRLESVIGTENGELTFIQGSGFEPNADLSVESQSYSEKRALPAKAGADGSYFATLMPYVLGKQSGKTVFQVKSKTCSPSLTFEWGTYNFQ
jgi:hypothetical protein